ncbi:MAG: sulfotransferase [Deltaproteobacteria bacterium]|nr:sulfotransferase [Deltaproteobacteria bacterium]MBW2069621.1 sulfotransferase [Deltaproteobacteria bacterium]
MIRKLCNDKELQLEYLQQTCLQHILAVTEPLVLISQIQRSGGSLLSQLFDGHPQIHAHPHELMLGYKKKYIWPRIDLNDSPERWFTVLFERMVLEHSQKGYKKGRRDKEAFAFFFVPSLQKEIFLACLKSRGTRTLRQVFDAYMTSYFGAWINNQNMHGRKKIVTAFTPRLSEHRDNVARFFDVYPDGRLITIVRDPKNWYPSALRHVPEKYGDLKQAVSQWNNNTRAAILNKKHYGERMCIIAFEDLLAKAEAVMHHLAEFLDIEFADILLLPTFNKFPIKAHTSFEATRAGILSGPLSRYETLTGQQLRAIEGMTAETYAEVMALAAVFD